MKIKSVSATWIRVPIPEERQHTSDFGLITTMDSTLVRIETECGLVGHGEARASVFSSSVNIALNAIVEHELGPLIVGEDPRNITRLWDIFTQRLWHRGKAHGRHDCRPCVSTKVHDNALT